MAGLQNQTPRAVAEGCIGVIKIILARHGLPAWDFRTPIPGHGLAQWLEGERDAALEPVQRPPPGADLEQLIRDARCLIASPLLRSTEPAHLNVPVVGSLIVGHL